MSKVLIIAPHPDDETLGCGGTILKHSKMKDSLDWCIVTFGNKGMGHGKVHMNKWNKIVNNVKKELGINKMYKLSYPTGELDQIPMRDIIDSLKKVIIKSKPDIIYVNYSQDVHTDHEITFKALMSAAKNFNFPFIKQILMYETPSETEYVVNTANNSFAPNHFVDITNFIDLKIKIFYMYKSEVMKKNLPRTKEYIKSLAGYRGARIGKKFAEAFVILFSIS